MTYRFRDPVLARWAEIARQRGAIMSGFPKSGGGGTGNTTTAAARISTSETTTSASYTDLATVGPAVTLTVGPSGILVCHFSSFCQINAAAGNAWFLSVALTGGNVVAASDANGMEILNAFSNQPEEKGTTVVLTGLTTTSTTVTLKYKTNNAANTNTYSQRCLAVSTF